MRRKIMFSLSISLIMCILLSVSASAYLVASSRPSSKTLTWGIHSTTPSDAVNPAINSAGNWGSNDGLAATYNFTSYTGDIDATDSKNSVGARVSSIPGAPSGWVACTPHPASNYTTFDIVINSNCTFGNGSGTTYYDYQGVFTHEFGHVFGLADLYEMSPECIGKTATNIPTMYGKGTLFGVLVYYNLRTQETDDINGKKYVSSLIN